MKGPNIGEAILIGRVRKGWSQIDLAKKLGLTSAAVSNWEKNKTTPPGDMLVYLIDLLNLHPLLFPTLPVEVREPVATYPQREEESQSLPTDSLQKEIETLQERVAKMEREIKSLKRKIFKK